MKKIISIFIFGVCLSAMFGDTGYNGHRWHERFGNFSVGTSIHYLDEKYLDGWALPIVQEKEILGQKGCVHYGFGIPNTDLVFAAYYIPNEKVFELEKKFKGKKKLLDIKIPQNYSEEYLESLKEENQITDPIGLDWELIIDYYAYTATICEREGLSAFEDYEPEGTCDCRFVIYDYNDDTRVYIFENAINGRSAVVYVPHEQDY